MEAEVVRIVCHLFNGDKASCGTASSFSFISIICTESYKLSIKMQHVRFLP